MSTIEFHKPRLQIAQDRDHVLTFLINTGPGKEPGCPQVSVDGLIGTAEATINDTPFSPT